LGVAPWSLTGIFAFAIPVLWFTCFFAGFNTRRRINAGEHVEDGVGDIINGLLRNKTLALAILVIVGIAFAGTFLDIATEFVRRAVPILLVIIALYVIFRKK
jgi:hypothetical protein